MPAPCLIETRSGRRLPLVAQRTELGRAAGCGIQVLADSVSAVHAVILTAEGEATLLDLDSTNGTRVNGVRVTRRVLIDGDRIHLGSEELRFTVSGAPREDPDRAQAPPRGFPTVFGSHYERLVEAQVTPDASRCVQCGICSYNCPMEIDVRGHARRGVPVVASHCLTCGECVKNCPRGVLAFERNPVFAEFT
jgi:NAD-dependent dihydropyrimidine dehydrogenase PreA subunit